jgi:predicted restriction endonuclease
MDISIKNLLSEIESDRVKGIDIASSSYFQTLLDKYDNDKVYYCIQSIQPVYDNLVVDQLIPDQPIAKQPHPTVVNNKERYVLTVARDDKEFREIVKNKFKKCIICSNNECSFYSCEVAHIWNFSDCDAGSKYDINNGLLLCANNHILFDKHLIKFNILDSSKGIVSIYIDEKLKDCTIYKYNGNQIILSLENIKYLEKRYSQIA